MESGRDLISITKLQSFKSDSAIRTEDLGAVASEEISQ